MRLAQLLRRSVLEPYARRRRRRMTIRQLTALDDRLLADIGLHRSQIELAVDGRLARHDDGLWRPARRPAEAGRREPPPARRLSGPVAIRVAYERDRKWTEDDKSCTGEAKKPCDLAIASRVT